MNFRSKQEITTHVQNIRAERPTDSSQYLEDMGIIMHGSAVDSFLTTLPNKVVKQLENKHKKEYLKHIYNNSIISSYENDYVKVWPHTIRIKFQNQPYLYISHFITRRVIDLTVSAYDVGLMLSVLSPYIYCKCIDQNTYIYVKSEGLGFAEAVYTDIHFICFGRVVNENIYTYYDFLAATLEGYMYIKDNKYFLKSKKVVKEIDIDLLLSSVLQNFQTPTNE